MLSNGLKIFTDIPLTVLGMILFLAAFTAVTLWTFFRRGSKIFYNKIADLPLTDEESP